MVQDAVKITEGGIIVGFVDKFKTFIGVPEDDYFEENDDEMQASVEDVKEERERERSRGRERERDNDYSMADNDEGFASERISSNKVVNIHATTQLQVVLLKPERYEDATDVADHLVEKHTVVLNLEKIKPDVSRRILDFLCGVSYALNGQVKIVANGTYIITPYNVGVMGDLLDELENSGLY